MNKMDITPILELVVKLIFAAVTIFLIPKIKKLLAAKVKDNGKGMPGNMNSEICRYHGWRGTSDGIIKTAYGLRRIKSMETIDKYSNDEGHYQSVKIVVGADIAPEEE